MQKENFALLVLHAGTSAAEQFKALREELKESFAIPLLPKHPRKRSRDDPAGPSADFMADRLKMSGLILRGLRPFPSW